MRGGANESRKVEDERREGKEGRKGEEEKREYESEV